jgi:hypothetical protein
VTIFGFLAGRFDPLAGYALSVIAEVQSVFALAFSFIGSGGPFSPVGCTVFH